MRIDALALRNFRNYDALNVTFAPDCNVIVGENAQGKTNLLEAIVYLSSARSPRARAEKELISFGKSECSIKANAFARNRDFLLEIALAAGRRRKILINKVPVKKGSDLSDVLGAVYFCPEDLLLIRDGAAARRKFMDDALCQLRARYAQALSDYHRAYEHKTRILRDSEEYPSLLDTLPEFDLRMAQSGAVIIYYRARFCERLKEYAGIAHRECSGGREELGVEYQTVSTISDPLAPIETIYDQLRAHQASHAAAERASRMCLSGPHKDDIAVTIGGVNARQFSSQGQTRTAALAARPGGRPSGRRPRRAVCTGTGFIGPGAPLYGRAGREHGTEGEGREPSLPEREQRPSPMRLHEQAGPQFGERKIVEHLPVGCHGVEFPPHGNHVRKPSATPFGPTVVAAVENERRRQPAQGLPDRTLDASRIETAAAERFAQPDRNLIVKFG